MASHLPSRSARTSQPIIETSSTRESEDGARAAYTPEPDQTRAITEVKAIKADPEEVWR